MSWDGNGAFSRTNGTQTGASTWANARDAANNITASQHDTHDQDLAAGIGACLTKNGETKATTDLAPNATGSYDLGTGALKWRDLNLSRNAVIGGTCAIDGNCTIGNGATDAHTINGDTTFTPASATTFVVTDDANGGLIGMNSNHKLSVQTNSVVRSTWDAGGAFLTGKVTASQATVGAELWNTGQGNFTRNGGVTLNLNRLTDDGALINFDQDGTTEGTITVSGTTIALNGAHLGRFSQIAGEVPSRGTVLSSTGEMCAWEGEENEQLVKVKVSDVAQDRTVYGVMDLKDDGDITIAGVGDFVIRVTGPVKNGDLLESAGDGTARAQSNQDQRFAWTIGKAVVNDQRTQDRVIPCLLLIG